MKTASFVLLMVVSIGVGALHGQTTGRTEAKLERIVIPSFVLKDASLALAVDTIRSLSREFDELESEPEWKGVRIGFERQRPRERHRVVLDLVNVTLGDALEAIATAANRRLDIYRDGVVFSIKPPEERAEGKGAMITRHFRITRDFLELPVDDEEAEPDGNADDPFADLDDRGPTRRRKSAREVLESVGVTFPEGAKAIFNPDRELLLVRNTRENMELVEAYLAVLGPSGYPWEIRLRAEIYSVESNRALALLRRDDRGQAPMLRRDIEKLVADGQAKIVGTPSVVTNSGQRAKAESGLRLEIVKDYEIGKDGKDKAVVESVFVGHEFEVEPTVGPDGMMISVVVALSVSEVPEEGPLTRTRTILAPASGREVQVESVLVPSRTIMTAVEMLDGESLLVGSVSEDPKGERTLIAILSAVQRWPSSPPVYPE